MSGGEEGVRNELGVVVGNAIQAGSLSVHIHGGGRRLPVPRQVPFLEGPFVNRREEIEKLNGLLDQQEVGLTPVAVINGTRGVGKTSIGRYWAHVNGTRFEGGSLHADFDDLRQEGGVDIHALLGSFLRALGFHDEVIPETLEGRSALFISEAAEKKILLLLDNVDFDAQVKSLMPGPYGSVVVVTSRAQLTELVSGGATWIELEPLEEGDAVQVLTRASGRPERVEAEPAAAKSLVDVCGGLPIALRVCGALLARESHRPVSWLADHLSDETQRLRRMKIESKKSIDLVFTEAYRSLTPTARALYRQLGAHQGTSFSGPLAAAVVEAPPADARALLAELRGANLIEGREDRFRFHDLLRIHARQTASEEEAEADREAALRRIVDFYVASSQRMDYAIIPERLRLSSPPEGVGPPVEPAFGSTAEALGWFDAERANMLAVMRAAAAREWDEDVWRLGEALWLPYHNLKHYGEAIEVYTLAATSAGRLGNRDVEARMRSQLARAYLDLDDRAGAEAEMKVAMKLSDKTARPELRASVVEFNGVVAAAQERYPEAIEAFEYARDVSEEEGSRRGIVVHEYHLGRVLDLDGQHERAIKSLQRAIDLIDRDSDGLTLGRALLHLGEAQRAVGKPEVAIETLREAVDTMAREKAPFYEAQARERLARVRLELGDKAEARRQLEQALEVYLALESPRAEEVKSALAQARGERG